MARTTDSKVRETVESDCNISLTRFIKRANLFTTRVAACAEQKGVTLSSDELEEIETLMAAHYYSTRDQRYKSRSTERASGAFVDHEFLDDAKSLDGGTGCVAALFAGARASLIHAANNKYVPPVDDEDEV